MNRDRRAYDALSALGNLSDLIVRTRQAMDRAASARPTATDAERLQSEPFVQGEASPLTREASATPFGNALDVLVAGPATRDEEALARALAAHAFARFLPASDEAIENGAAQMLWLAAHTAFDATSLLDLALGDRAAPVWSAVARRVCGVPGARATWAETLVGAAALGASSSAVASRLAVELVAASDDARLARVLGGVPSDNARGELARPPRGRLAAMTLGLTGVSLVLHAASLLARLALAYRRPVELNVDSEGALHVHYRVEFLGRTLRDANLLVPRSGLLRATRDVRYPAAALYAGLLSLVVGSYVGVSALVDGLRVTSPSLITAGLAIVAVGLALDFGLSSILPGRRGQCRVLLVPRAGRPLCVGGLAIAEADALLASIARAPARPVTAAQDKAVTAAPDP